LEKKKVFSLDLKTAKELLLRTVFGSEFHTAGAEHRKARFAVCVSATSSPASVVSASSSSESQLVSCTRAL